MAYSSYYLFFGKYSTQWFWNTVWLRLLQFFQSLSQKRNEKVIFSVLSVSDQKFSNTNFKLIFVVVDGGNQRYRHSYFEILAKNWTKYYHFLLINKKMSWWLVIFRLSLWHTRACISGREVMYFSDEMGSKLRNFRDVFLFVLK